MRTLTKPKSKVLSSRKKELARKNVQVIAKQITDMKDLKYKYPTDHVTLKQRKSFRSEARRVMNSLESKISEISHKTSKEAREIKETLKVELARARSRYLIDA